jgi:hypothetical protein
MQEGIPFSNKTRVKKQILVETFPKKFRISY